MSNLRISKLDASRRQLESAIVLYFQESDPVSIHTLTCAAYDVLRALNAADGGEPMLKDAVVENVKPEFVSEVRGHLNEAQNFFKHADQDREGVLEFNPAFTEWLLLDASWVYRKLASEKPPMLGLFHLWAVLHFAKDWVQPDPGQQLKPATVVWLAGLSRSAFFAEMLPTAHTASIALRPDA